MMWPLLLTSIIALTITFERLIFIILERLRRQPCEVEKMLSSIKHHDFEQAIKIGEKSSDLIARFLTRSLKYREASLSQAFIQAATRELNRYHSGLSVLDTVITLAPLLGLLGTVTGMIHSFELLGAAELNAPAAITGGVAEALIATAFGLGVAILALVPYNYFNSCLEQARLQIQDATLQVELSYNKLKTSQFEHSMGLLVHN